MFFFARTVRSLPLFLLLFLLGSLAGCSDGGPLEGYWGGDRLTFQVNDGHVLDLRPLKVSCNGEDGCYADFFFVDPSLELAIDGMHFSGTLENAAGSLDIVGDFETDRLATGTYHFVSASGCCELEGNWKAEFLKPYDPPVEDVREGDDAEPVDEDVVEDATPPSSEYPPSATPEQIAAIQYVNELRHVLDLPLVKEIESINLAAQAHAEYFEYHCAKYLNSNLSPHSENAAWPEGFSGNNFSDRMKKFGFTGMAGWEVMAFNGNPIAAVDGWVATLYHRIPFVHPSTYELGYGTVKGGCYTWAGGTDVMDFSKHSVQYDHPVAYPYDGQTGVSPGWGGYESPQPPLPAGQSYPSGPIITLTFPEGGGKFSITDHKLLDANGTEVAHMYVDPSNDPAGFLQSTLSIYAYSPLQGFATYTVRITGKWKNQDQTWEWSFTTGAESDWYM
jgi:uncharacterized protein YkwD